MWWCGLTPSGQDHLIIWKQISICLLLWLPSTWLSNLCTITALCFLIVIASSNRNARQRSSVEQGLAPGLRIQSSNWVHSTTEQFRESKWRTYCHLCGWKLIVKIDTSRFLDENSFFDLLRWWRQCEKASFYGSSSSCRKKFSKNAGAFWKG